MVRAEIIAVGTELLLGQIVNTNAQYLSQELASLGIGVYFHTVVGDNLQRLQSVLEQAIERSSLVILTGGLGPTSDDLTREAVAAALNRPLLFDETVWQEIAGRMQRFGRIPVSNRKQAMVPAGARVLPNPNGTAPGLMVELGSKLVVLLPGPPRELQPMFQAEVRPALVQMSGHGVILSRSLRTIGIGESALEEEISDLIESQTNPTIALYAKLGEVEIRLTALASSEEEACRLIAPTEHELRQRLGERIYGINSDTLAGVIGRELKGRGYRLALAESCTGGLLGHMVTSVPGSSAYFQGSLVCYSNECKQAMLGVQADTLHQYGAVSSQCALQMARGAAKALQADVAISVTGIAGPDGGSPEKPVGTVYVAVVTPQVEQVERLSLRGARASIQERAAKTALNIARLALPSGEAQ